MKSRLTMEPNIGENAIIDWVPPLEHNDKCFIRIHVPDRYEAPRAT